MTFSGSFASEVSEDSEEDSEEDSLSEESEDSAGSPVSEDLLDSAALLEQPAKAAALICFIILNLILGLFSQPIVNWLEQGLRMFA